MAFVRGRRILMSVACVGFGVAQVWAASYLTSAGAPGQAWRVDGGLGYLIWGAGLLSACTGVWAGLTSRRRA